MIRILLFYLLPLCVVIALYLIWVYREKIKSPPKAVIIVIIIALISIAFAGYILRKENFNAESSYHAPRIENGKIIPAQITPS